MSQFSKLVFSVLFLGAFVMNAQEKATLSYYLPDGVTYNKTIPTPESVIGHEVGKWHVTHDKLVMYMKVLANSSDRITLEDRGKFVEIMLN